MIGYLTGIKTNPPKHIDAEYARVQKRCRRCALDTFTPSESHAGMDAGSLLITFFMNPLQGVFKRS